MNDDAATCRHPNAKFEINRDLDVVHSWCPDCGATQDAPLTWQAVQFVNKGCGICGCRVEDVAVHAYWHAVLRGDERFYSQPEGWEPI